MTEILLVGNDYWGREAARRVNKVFPEVIIFADSTNSLRRVLRLILRKRISLESALKIVMCALHKGRFYSSKRSSFAMIGDNEELQLALKEFNPSSVILFRAGLILDKKTLSYPADFLNIHAARLPEYPGLGALTNAIKDGQLLGAATLHRINSRVDDGEIIDFFEYHLTSSMNYCTVESIAYEAGISLLLHHLQRNKRLGT